MPIEMAISRGRSMMLWVSRPRAAADPPCTPSLHRRRRSGRSRPDHRSRPPPARDAPTSSSTTTRHRAAAAPGARRMPRRSMSARAAPQPLTRTRSRCLLVEKAREGKSVVRLKWGDPFVFDSGGKEALFLHEQGIPFEVVPGIPSGDRHARLCGHPDHVSGCAATSLTLVRGHEAERDSAPDVDWRSWRSSTARWSATPAPDRSRAIARRCSSTAARPTTRPRSSTTARRRRSRRSSARSRPLPSRRASDADRRC